MLNFSLLADGDESGDVLTHCSVCDQEIDQCECSSILEDCHLVNKYVKFRDFLPICLQIFNVSIYSVGNCRVLAGLGILEKLSVGMIHTIMLTQIQSHVQDSCAGNFASSQIEILEKVDWLFVI